MAKLLFISKGEHAASTRYRALNYYPLLQQDGWAVQHLSDQGSWPNRLRILRQAQQADVVIILRRTYSGWFLKRLRRTSKHLIFDFDDAIFGRDDGTVSTSRQRRFAATVQLCDQVWAGNAYLAEQAVTYNANVHPIPTSLDVRPYAVTVHRPSDSLDLVWIGSSATRPYLEQILPALEKATESVPNLRLKVIADFSLPTNKLKVIPVIWSSMTEVQELVSAHIGLAPLSDNAWTRGKCGLKVLQCMAASLPVIASPVGVHREMVQPEVNGLWADSADAWVDAITQLAQQPDLREHLGQAGRKTVQADYALDKVYSQITYLLASQPTAISA